jgi:hypothetical protein
MAGLLIWEGVVVQRFLHPRYPWGFLVRVLAATGVMMLVVCVLQFGLSSDLNILLLILVTGAGAFVYLAMLMWLRPVTPEHGKMLEGLHIPGIALLVSRIGRPEPESSEPPARG